jgi:anti-sigma factor RsiW
MTCRELAAVLADLIGDELPPERRREAEVHLHDCPGCMALLDSYRLTIRLARRLPPLAPPPALLERLRTLPGR